MPPNPQGALDPSASRTSFIPFPMKRTIDGNFGNASGHAVNVQLPPKQPIKQSINPQSFDKENQQNFKSFIAPLFQKQNKSTTDTTKLSTSTSTTSDERGFASKTLLPLDDKTNTSRVEKPHEWDDLDAEDANDPLMISEYVEEIMQYMRTLEAKTMPNPNYMETQKELEWDMRAMLVDWMIEIHHKLKLLQETLFIAVNSVDRFLSQRPVSLAKLQLVGIAALLIASKFEEVVSPSISNFVYLSDNTFNDKEILKAERYMLHVLNYSLTYPSPLTFLRRISKADNYDIRTRTLAKYFMEVVLMDETLLNCPPSMMAAASLWLARRMLGRGMWNANLIHYSGNYTEEQIICFSSKIVEYLKKPTKYEAVFNKYSSKKYMKASIFSQEYVRSREL